MDTINLDYIKILQFFILINPRNNTTVLLNNILKEGASSNKWPINRENAFFFMETSVI